MAGAWERVPSVLAAVLHTDFTSMAWAFGLRSLQIPGPVIPVAGMPYDHARNKAAMTALELGVDYLFFLDSDVIPPPDAIHRLLKHDLPIVSGMYCRRSPPVGIPVMMRNHQWITEFKRGSMQEVDLVGAGCLLIRRDVLKGLPPQRPGKHWFDWRVDMSGVIPPHECMSEDFTFCSWARNHGLKIMVDTSIVCRHVGFGEASDGKFDSANVYNA